MASADQSSPAVTGTIDVETPELVVLSYTVAGVGSRAYAAFIDYLICFVLFFVAVIMLAVLAAKTSVFAGMSGSWAAALIILLQFAILWGYYILWEGLADGQTPGKRRMRLRVVRDGGYSVDFATSAVRNLLRFIDMQPVFFYGIGLGSVVATRDGKRLGDLVAGTIVVREEVQDAANAGIAATPAPMPGEPPRQALLMDDEYALLDRFVARRHALPPEKRQQLATQLAERFRDPLSRLEHRPGTGSSTAARLVALHAAERAARAGGAAPLGAKGAARERHAIVATRSPRWNAFATRLADAQRRGLASLGEAGVREFVADYRELAADLARLQTASRGTARPEVFHLSRLVAGAHNLLYQGRSLSLLDVVRYLTVAVPGEIRRSWRPILLAAAMLFLPMAIAATAVTRSPEAAKLLVPPHMHDRAADGVRRAATDGEGYVDVPEVYRPVMASEIVANNVQVAYVAFAAGIAFGLPTVLLLVMNGVSIGAIFGLYAAKGIFPLILAFVAPHGVLELFAICVAGAGGLLLGKALLIPGARTRRRALVEESARAARLIAGVTVLLVIAGTIEGLVSPIPWWPLEGKLAVSGVTAAVLYLYLRSGAGRATTAPRGP